MSYICLNLLICGRDMCEINSMPLKRYIPPLEIKNPALFYTQLLEQKLDQRLFNLCMPGNRCLPSVKWICINIMSAAVSFQVAAGFDKLADQACPFQTATSISMVLDSGYAETFTSSITI